MPQKTLTNPLGAFTPPVADWRTGRDGNGTSIEAFQIVFDDFLSTGVILKGDLVNLVPPTTAATPPVWKQEAAASADALARIRGVALNGTSASGQQVKVCVSGFCHVNVGAAGVPAVDLPIIRGALAGLALQGAAAVAADPVGTFLGVFLGAKDANNQAWCFIRGQI
jgi:hypothetical protein